MKFVSVDIPYLGKEYFKKIACIPGVEVLPIPKENPTSDSDIITRIGDAELVTSDITVNLHRGILAACPNLKAIFCQSVGYDHIDIKFAQEQGIKVYNCAGFNANAVAEFAFSLMTSLCRHITEAQAHVKAGGWLYKLFIGSELYGKTIGIIGSGNVAQHLARIARGYGMEVISYTAHPSEQKARLMGIQEFLPFDKLLKISDFVVLAIPLSFQTKHLIGKDELSLMKKTAILINVARHTIVDETAVAEAIIDGKIAGVALDMMYKEPFNAKEFPIMIQEFVRRPNVIVTPHIAGVSYESGRKLGEVFVENVKTFLAGGSKNCVSC